MKKSGVFMLLVILILVSSISFVSAGWFDDIWDKITGRVVENETLVCTDSDGGLNYYVSGESCSDVECALDGCHSDGSLTETYCEDNNIKTERYNCPYGCSEGACAEELLLEPEPESEPETCAAKITINFDKATYEVGEQFEVELGVFDSQGNSIPNYAFYAKMYDDRWHTPSLDRTGSDGYFRKSGTIEASADVTRFKFNVFTKEIGACGSVQDNTEIGIIRKEVPEPRPEPRPEPEPETCAAKIKITLDPDKEIYYIGDYVELVTEILDSQGNHLPNYPFYFQVYTYDDGIWHDAGEHKTDRQGYSRTKDKIEEGKQPTGKLKLKVSTPDIGKCSSVEDTIETEIRKGEDTEEVCGIGVCVPEEEEEVVDIPEGGVIYSCSGCELEGKCYPMGYRKEERYCSEDYEFIEQRGEGSCDNNFECESNVCISGECVGEGLMRKIIKWFKKMFGGEEEDEEPEEKQCSKWLIEKDIGEYDYGESGYGDSKEAQAPLYSKDGEQIGTIKCCRAQYLDEGKHGGMALICPFDSREDMKNSLRWLSARGEITSGEYKDEQVYKIGEPVIIWTHKDFAIAVGGGEGPEPEMNVPLPEDVADAYLKKYKNDLDVIDTPKPPMAADEFLKEVEGLGAVTLVDFETLLDGTIPEREQKVSGGEWESLGVVFETPSEDYLQLVGPVYPFNPLDKLSLSPGLGPFVSGSDTHDDLNIIFSEPVRAVGVYLLDLGETDDRESISFLDAEGNVIERISPWPKSTFGNPAPGVFVSLIHDGISKIEILENPGDSDDIAYDNLYFVR